MNRKSFVIVLALGMGLLILAACASQPGSPESARPTLDLNAPTPTPELPPLQGSGEVKNPQPTLELGQPTPTPEALPPSGGQVPDPSQVQPLNTAPVGLTLKDADDGDLPAEFYPAPQPSQAALILVSASDQDLSAWELLAQSAQVKGLAALVLELPKSGATPQATNAAVLWLQAPENGGFQKFVVAGSETGTLPALAAFGLGPEVRAAVLFSPPAGDPALATSMQAAGDRPVLVVQAGKALGAPEGTGPNVEVRSIPGGGNGVEALLSQVGVLEDVLNWCEGRFH